MIKKQRKNKAQATIEFSMAFILAVLFLFLSCNLFVWFNRNVIQRQAAYEASRSRAATSPEADNPNVAKNLAEPGKLDFYITSNKDPNCTNPNNCQPNPNYRPLNVFVSGGYNK